MKKIKPPFTKYPGNKWLSRELARLDIDAAIPFVHGVIRGALANPAGVHPAQAFGMVCREKDPSGLSSQRVGRLSLALLYLWNDTAANYDMGRKFPQALTADPLTRKDERTFNDEVVDLADGFLEGFCLVRIPKRYRSEACESFFLDIVNEAKLCLRWYDHPEEFIKEYEDPDLRLGVLKGCLAMIEETMVWLHLYAQHAARDGNLFSGGVRKDKKGIKAVRGTKKNMVLN